jgi:hypothetical protein
MGGAPGPIVRSRARSTAGAHDRLDIDVPPTGAEVVGCAGANLRERAARVAGCGVVGAEQRDVAPPEPLGEDHVVAHVLVEHRAVADHGAEVVGRRQRDANAVPDRA